MPWRQHTTSAMLLVSRLLLILIFVKVMFCHLQALQFLDVLNVHKCCSYLISLLTKTLVALPHYEFLCRLGRSSYKLLQKWICAFFESTQKTFKDLGENCTWTFLHVQYITTIRDRNRLLLNVWPTIFNISSQSNYSKRFILLDKLVLCGTLSNQICEFIIFWLNKMKYADKKYICFLNSVLLLI